MTDTTRRLIDAAKGAVEILERHPLTRAKTRELRAAIVAVEAEDIATDLAGASCDDVSKEAAELIGRVADALTPKQQRKE